MIRDVYQAAVWLGTVMLLLALVALFVVGGLIALDRAVMWMAGL